MTDLSKTHFENLLQQLAALGEDQTELDLWADVFNALTDEEKEDLIVNLEKEIKLLKG